MKQLLAIRNLHVSTDGKPIIRGISLSMNAGDFHVLMGPNGSGKSTLAYALLGHPRYALRALSLRFAGRDIRKLPTDKRARLGIFLGFQYPMPLSGVSLQTLIPEMLRTEKARPKAVHLTLASAMATEKQEKLAATREKTATLLQELGLAEEMLHRGLNDGFSGGEKKKAEIVQLFVSRPKLAILDEPDSGLDIDALKSIAHTINAAHAAGTAILLITHYARILKYLKPDQVHIMNHGVIVRSGDAQLAEEVEHKGYAHFSKEKKHALAHSR